MSNTYIHLPIPVTLHRLEHVVAKLAGAVPEITVFEEMRGGRHNRTAIRPPFDPSKPSENANPWHHDFKKEAVWTEANDQRTMSFVTLCFTDGAGSQWGWLYHLEDPDMEGYKTLGPGSHALGVAMGRRLVEFFGGKMVYNDAIDRIDYEVDPADALFPPRKNRQSSDSRWHQFENALQAMPPLRANELEAGAVLSAEGKLSPAEKKLLQYLSALEREQSLSTALPSEGRPRSPKPRF